MAAPVITSAAAPALAPVHTEPHQYPNSNDALATQEVTGSGNKSTGHTQTGDNTEKASNPPLNNAPASEVNGSKAPEAPVTSPTKPPVQTPAAGATTPQQQSVDQGGSGNEGGGDEQSKGAIIMVSFKMGADAKDTFTGELLVSRRAKATSMGVVAYLAEGKEETIEVPLKFVELVSINN